MLNIIFENKQYLVVDKPAGLVVNRSETMKEETLQDQLADYLGLVFGDLGIGDRAGIVHRLDRETSGLLIVAKTMVAFENLQSQFKMRQVKKEYLALVHGHVEKLSDKIEVSLVRAGRFGKFTVAKKRDYIARETVTEYRVLETLKFNEQKLDSRLQAGNFAKSRINYLKKQARDYSYLRVSPKTGRTHQIRVVTKYIGHPAVSDLIYTPNKLLKFDLTWCPRLFLHATFLEFKDPASQKTVSFESPLPKELEDAKKQLS